MPFPQFTSRYLLTEFRYYRSRLSLPTTYRVPDLTCVVGTKVLSSSTQLPPSRLSNKISSSVTHSAKVHTNTIFSSLRTLTSFTHRNSSTQGVSRFIYFRRHSNEGSTGHFTDVSRKLTKNHPCL